MVSLDDFGIAFEDGMTANFAFQDRSSGMADFVGKHADFKAQKFTVDSGGAGRLVPDLAGRNDPRRRGPRLR